MNQLVEVIQGITGWRTSLYELMKVGQRRLNMMRAFNAREGITSADDVLPKKMLAVPLKGGPTDGIAISEKKFLAARKLYYEMAGWDEEGVPTRGKLAELGLEWVVELLG